MTVALTGALMALAGCGVNRSPWEGTQLDQFGWYACDDFAKQLSKAGGADLAYELRSTQRAEFVAGLTETAGQAQTPEIKDAAVVLARTVDASQDAWKLGLDTFASRCLDHGWNGGGAGG